MDPDPGGPKTYGFGHRIRNTVKKEDIWKQCLKFFFVARPDSYFANKINKVRLWVEISALDPEQFWKRMRSGLVRMRSGLERMRFGLVADEIWLRADEIWLIANEIWFSG